MGNRTELIQPRRHIVIVVPSTGNHSHRHRSAESSADSSDCNFSASKPSSRCCSCRQMVNRQIRVLFPEYLQKFHGKSKSGWTRTEIFPSSFTASPKNSCKIACRTCTVPRKGISPLPPRSIPVLQSPPHGRYIPFSPRGGY